MLSINHTISTPQFVALPNSHLSRARWSAQAGAKVALDLASFEVVRAHLPDLLELLRSSSIDVCFCNEARPAAPCARMCHHVVYRWIV